MKPATITLMAALFVSNAKAGMTVEQCFATRLIASDLGRVCGLNYVNLRPRSLGAFFDEKGYSYYWSKKEETYCYQNQYDNERCITRNDIKDYVCSEINGNYFCRYFPK